MNCSTFTDHLAEYVEQELSEIERDQMTAHAQSCPACRQELEQMTVLHTRLLRDGRSGVPVALVSSVMYEIQEQRSLRGGSPVWRFIMAHKISVLSGCAAACLAIVATIALVFAQPNPAQVAQTTPPAADISPATLPARGGAGARTLSQRVTAAQVIVRVAVEQVGKPDPEQGADDVPVQYRVIRVLHGALPGTSKTLRSSSPALLVARSPQTFAVGKEQILFLDQVREADGQLTGRELSTFYDSAPGRLDETEKQILEISKAPNPTP